MSKSTTPKVKVTPSVYTNIQLHDSVLNVSAAYQRDLYMEFVKRDIVANFNWAAFGQIVVGKRTNGSKVTYWIVDGQQRRAAAVELGYSMIPCAVFASSGEKHEATIYNQINHGKKQMSPYEIWKARLVAQDADALAITQVIRKYGFEIVASAKTWNQIQAVRAVLSAYALPPAAFEAIFEVAATAFKGQTNAVSDAIIKGLYLLFKQYGPLVNKQDLIARLSKFSPTIIIGNAVGRQAKVGRNLGNGYARYNFVMTEMKEIYNKRRKVGLLP